MKSVIKRWQLVIKPHPQPKGFTLVEVLVAILMITLFVAVAMQAVVFSAVFKVRARQIAKATDWIQEDLETVRGYAGTQVPFTERRLTQNAAADQNVIMVDSTDGFRIGDAVLIGSDSTSNNVQSINSGTNEITLAQNLATLQASGTKVIARCRPNEGDTNGGFAAYLMNNLPPLIQEGTTTIAGKQYTLSRKGSDSNTPTIRNNRPYELLEITYEVMPVDGDKPIAKVSTEVIPDAFFQCP